MLTGPELYAWEACADTRQTRWPKQTFPWGPTSRPVSAVYFVQGAEVLQTESPAVRHAA